jgi:flagellar biosynthesis/type III secretory pathway protein FliH
MTPKPMPSWIAPRKISTMMPAVNTGSIPPDSRRGRSQAPVAPAEADLAPISSHHTQINVLEEESPELQALRQQNAQLEQALTEAITDNVKLRRNVIEASEKDLVKLSIAVAEQVIGRELRAAPELVIEWAHQAIQLLATDEDVQIAISPEVEPLLPAEKWAEFFPAAIVIVDPTLQPGQTQVRSKSTRVGTGRADRIAAIVEALGESAK